MKSDEIVVINFSRCPMRKSLSPKKKIVCSAILGFLTLFTLLWFVFRNHYKEIFQNIQTASIRGLLWILCMGYLNNFGFPAYQNTECMFFPTGESAFIKILEALKNAKHYIFLEYFIIQDGKCGVPFIVFLKKKPNKV